VTLAVAADGAQVTIDVIDSGTGMSPGFVRDRLFKPFVSSKPGGFGIGAYESRQLAQAMQGRIEVVSREGAGSRFRVILKAGHAADVSVERAA
jgi:signal transduction histidine kinase